MSNISDLRFDDKNFNKHTAKGMSLLEKSLQKNGAGRSILIDKNNNIIAGNGIVEAAGSVGIENVKIVETSGSEIIAVKRTDLELNSKKGREMALADNAVAAADLSWDEDAIGEAAEAFDFEPKEWLDSWLDEPANLDGKDEEKQFKITLSFKNNEDLENFLEEHRSKFDEYNCTYSVSGGEL